VCSWTAPPERPWRNSSDIYSTVVFLDLIKETTSPLLIPSSTQEKTALLVNISIYRLFLLFPFEYFTTQSLSHLIKGALCADSGLMTMCASEWVAGLDREVVEGLVTLRVFLRRVCEHVGFGLDVVCFDGLSVLVVIKKSEGVF
jgi:hypothetical protein